MGDAVPAAPKAPAANGKSGKPKGKASSDPKRRRTNSAGPTLSNQDEVLVEPAAIDITHWRAPENAKHFEEWGWHYSKLCQQNHSLAEEDASALRENNRKQLDERQATLDKQKQQHMEQQLQQQKDHQYLLDHPMPRPEGLPIHKKDHRHNPLSATKA